MRKNRLYLACSWFTAKQKELMDKGYALLKENPTVDWENSYRPLDHQYQGINIDDHPEMLASKEWEIATYNNDLLGLRRADVCIFLYSDDVEDPGQGFELGYAKALGKQCVFILRDKKPTKPINLMLAVSPDRIITVDELKDFDFNNIEFDYYEGKVY